MFERIGEDMDLDRKKRNAFITLSVFGGVSSAIYANLILVLYVAVMFIDFDGGYDWGIHFITPEGLAWIAGMLISVVNISFAIMCLVSGISAVKKGMRWAYKFCGVMSLVSSICNMVFVGGTAFLIITMVFLAYVGVLLSGATASSPPLNELFWWVLIWSVPTLVAGRYLISLILSVRALKLIKPVPQMAQNQYQMYR